MSLSDDDWDLVAPHFSATPVENGKVRLLLLFPSRGKGKVSKIPSLSCAFELNSLPLCFCYLLCFDEILTAL